MWIARSLPQTVWCAYHDANRIGSGMEQFFAHTPVDDGPWHELVPHLKGTADKAERYAAKFGASELARLAGLWHDLGKFNPEFQTYLRALLFG